MGYGADGDVEKPQLTKAPLRFTTISTSLVCGNMQNPHSKPYAPVLHIPTTRVRQNMENRRPRSIPPFGFRTFTLTYNSVLNAFLRRLQRL